MSFYSFFSGSNSLMSVCCINFSVAPLIVPDIPRTRIDRRILRTLLIQASAALVSCVFSLVQRIIPNLPSYDISFGFISLIPLSPNNDAVDSKISLNNCWRFIVCSDVTSKARYRFLSRKVGRVLIFTIFQYPPVYNPGFSSAKSQAAPRSLHRLLLLLTCRKARQLQPFPSGNGSRRWNGHCW